MKGPKTLRNIAFHRGYYSEIIMDRNELPQTLRIIAWNRGPYLAIIIDRNEGTQTSPYYSLA
jgi:hypothetical protein